MKLPKLREYLAKEDVSLVVRDSLSPEIQDYYDQHVPKIDNKGILFPNVVASREITYLYTLQTSPVFYAFSVLGSYSFVEGGFPREDGSRPRYYIVEIRKIEKGVDLEGTSFYAGSLPLYVYKPKSFIDPKKVTLSKKYKTHTACITDDGFGGVTFDFSFGGNFTREYRKLHKELNFLCLLRRFRRTPDEWFFSYKDYKFQRHALPLDYRRRNGFQSFYKGLLGY